MEITSTYREYETIPSISRVPVLSQDELVLAGIMSKENYSFHEDERKYPSNTSQSSRSSVCNEDGVELDCAGYFDNPLNDRNNVQFIPMEEDSDCPIFLGLLLIFKLLT